MQTNRPGLSQLLANWLRFGELPLSAQDPDSALSRGFNPGQSPLRMADTSPIDSIAKWMRFASVME